MAWHYLYDAVTGRLVSESSEAVVPPAGLLALVRETRAETSEMWDSVTRAFIARPPKVLIDRLQDLADDPVLVEVWSRLTVAQRQTLRDRLIALLGRHRFRNQSEPVNL